jgi:hypothetical protein
MHITTAAAVISSAAPQIATDFVRLERDNSDTTGKDVALTI